MAITEDDLWRLHDELAVSEAVTLILRDVCKPKDYHYLEYEANIRAAIIRAIDRGDISFRPDSFEPVDVHGNKIDFRAYQMISVESLRSWLSSKGFRPSFFFPDTIEGPEYLNPAHPRYSKKLAAAVEAWLNVSEVSTTHPKQAMTKWIRENAKRFGLTDSDGLPIDSQIEPIAMLANWKPQGGAPKTRSRTSS